MLERRFNEKDIFNENVYTRVLIKISAEIILNSIKIFFARSYLVSKYFSFTREINKNFAHRIEKSTFDTMAKE